MDDRRESVPAMLTGNDLRRHLRDFHHLDIEYLRIVPDGALAVEHEFHHEDGLDIEPHVHGAASGRQHLEEGA